MAYLSKADREAIAYAVADEWCEFALAKIKEGKQPARLSVQKRELIIGELQRDRYNQITHISKSAMESMCNSALHWAMQIIRLRDEYRPVLEHFAQRTRDEQKRPA